MKKKKEKKDVEMIRRGARKIILLISDKAALSRSADGCGLRLG